MIVGQPPSAEPTGDGHGRVVELDVLRAIAVLLVVGRHWPNPILGKPALAIQLLSAWQRGGWVGVDLFFVLSGFLVAGLLFREWERYAVIRPARFLIRRAFKIYPAFYVFFFLSLPLPLHCRWPVELNGKRLVGELFFLQNYLGSAWNHTWSLAIEEHFYLLIPFVLAALARRPQYLLKSVGLLAIVVSMACLCLRLYWAHTVNPNLDTVPAMTHLRVDSLMFGVLLSALYHQRTPAFIRYARTYRMGLLCLATVLLFPPFVLELTTTVWLKSVGPTVLYLGCGCWVALAVTYELGDSRWVRGLAYVGSHSYSIYLWHMPLVWMVLFSGSRWFGHPLSPWWLFPYIFAAGMVGIVAAKVVEFPLLHLRDKLFPSRINPMSTPTCSPHLANV